MNDEGSGRTDQERDLRLAIDGLKKSIDESRKSGAGDVTQADILLLLGHIVDLLNSEYGMLTRMMTRLDRHEKAIVGSNGDSVPLRDLTEAFKARKKWHKAILTIVLGLVLTTIWNIASRTRSQDSIEKKLDRLMLQLKGSIPVK